MFISRYSFTVRLCITCVITVIQRELAVLGVTYAVLADLKGY
jgi:hypothetical protein